MAYLKQRLVLVAALLSPWMLAPHVQADEELIQLLQDKRCPRCQLADVDLVHADLRDADLSGAELQRANLSQARLDGADLSGADLRFTSLQGASLRGANLRGANFQGTDLRDSDLSGAQLDANALEQAHWSGATGLPAKAQSHAALHNAGVMAAESGRWKAAEELFGKAIKRQPGTAESWIARGITREKLGKRQLAMQDFRYASTLYDKEGDSQKAEQLKAAAKALKEHITKPEGGNGIGSAVLNGLISTTQALIPLASKLFMPALGL
tara:strand:+ start:1319 stop:2122 length:804 start_codon:yes stop_codon:yes gene_type:complete